MQGQSYVEASNSCKEPNCDAYYFMTLNVDRHECRTVRKREKKKA